MMGLKPSSWSRHRHNVRGTGMTKPLFVITAWSTSTDGLTFILAAHLILSIKSMDWTTELQWIIIPLNLTNVSLDAAGRLLWFEHTIYLRNFPMDHQIGR